MENSLLEFHYNPDNALEHKSHRLQTASPPPTWQNIWFCCLPDWNDSPIIYLDQFSSEGSVHYQRISTSHFSCLLGNQDKSLLPLPNSVDTDNFRAVQECYLSLGLRRRAHFPNCPLDSSRTVLGLSTAATLSTGVSFSLLPKVLISLATSKTCPLLGSTFTWWIFIASWKLSQNF